MGIICPSLVGKGVNCQIWGGLVPCPPSALHNRERPYSPARSAWALRRRSNIAVLPGRGRGGHWTGHCKVQTGRSAGRPRGRRAVGSGQHRWWLWSARSKCRLVYIMATAQRFRLTPRAGGTFDLGPFAVSPPLLRCCRRRHAAHCTAALTRPHGGASYSERNTLLQQLFLLTGEWVLHGEFQLLHIDQIR